MILHQLLLRVFYANNLTDRLTFATKNSSNAETIALEIDTSQNSTFAGNVIFTDGAAYSSAASIRQQSNNLILSGGSDGYYFNKSDNSATHMRIDSSGNVGISNSSPRNDSGFVTLQVGNTTTAASQIVLDDNDSNGPWRIISNQSLIINDDATERMRIDSSGQVGIGATSMSEKLRVQGDSGSDLLVRFQPFTNNAESKLYLSSVSSGDGGYFYDANDNTSGLFAYGDYSFYVGTSNISGSIGDRRMIIKQNGLIGIGTDSPSYKTHIQGSSTVLLSLDARDTTTGAADTGAEMLFGGHDGSNARDFVKLKGAKENGTSGNYAGYFAIQTRPNGGSLTEKMRIDSSGRVAFGTSIHTSYAMTIAGLNSTYAAAIRILSGSTQFFVGANSTSSTSDFELWNAGNGYIRFATNNTERMRIESAGLARFKTQSGGYGFGSGYNFHEFNNDSGNQPIVVFNQLSGSGSHFGINVINNDDENDTTSRFFLGQGGSTERIKIFSNGNIQNSNNSYGQLSDIKLKENVTDATDKLDELMQVQIKNFNYIGEEQKQIGVIAQEIEQIFPSLVYENPETEYQEVDKTDEEGNIIYQTEQVLVSEAVEGQEAIEWEDKPTMDNTKVEIQTWLDSNSIEWQSADTKQELLDRIPEYQQEAVEAQDAVYETRETDIPETENLELPTGEVTKAVKYSVLVPIMIKAMQEQQEIINDLKARIENLEN